MKEYRLDEVEKILQEISPDFTIVPNPNSDLAGVYWKESFAEISMSKEKVCEVRNEGFIDDYGRPHVGLDTIVAKCKAFIERITTDAEYLQDITEEFDINKITVTDIEPIEPKTMELK